MRNYLPGGWQSYPREIETRPVIKTDNKKIKKSWVACFSKIQGRRMNK